MRLTLCLLFLILPCASVGADTLTFEKNGSLNGEVTYKEEKFTIVATFRGRVTKTYIFNRSKVKEIEINDNLMNQGPPPDWLFKYEARQTNSPKAGANATSTPKSHTTEPQNRDFSKLPGMRPPPNEPDAPPPPLAPVVDPDSGVITTPVEATEKIRFNDGDSRTGKLLLISKDTITARIQGREIPYARALVKSITVIH